MADKLEKVGELALEELERRLGSPQAAAELPGTALLQLCNAHLKLLAERQAAEPTEGEVVGSALDAILEAGLPAKRTAALLTDLLARIDEDRAAVLAKLEELA